MAGNGVRGRGHCRTTHGSQYNSDEYEVGRSRVGQLGDLIGDPAGEAFIY